MTAPSPGQEANLARRLLRVAIDGHVPADDPHVIADSQGEIERLTAALSRAQERIDELQSGAERYWEGRWRDADAQLSLARAEALEEALSEIELYGNGTDEQISKVREIYDAIRALKDKP